MGTLQVLADGFAPATISWRGSSVPLHIKLKASGGLQELTVSGTRLATRLADSASSVAAFSRADLTTSGALTLDDSLRQIPGFTLFRRSGSLAANPTSQGASLRAIGASGASRALVLYDGVPLNDPFGGWVYWDRVPQVAIQDVEVLRGGASDLYGNAALAGVVNIIPRRAASSILTAESYFGNSMTPQGSLFWSGRRKRTQLVASGEAFSTAGYHIVREQDRGAVDTKAAQQHRTARAGLEYELANEGRLFVHGTLFREERDNGTRLQDNNTRLGQVVAGTDWTSGTAGVFNVRLHAESVRYFQTFSSVAADRNSESLTRTQVVPSQRLGLSAWWSRAFSAHALVAGVEAQVVRGHSNELVYFRGAPTANQDNGGRQRFHSFFAEDIIRLGSNWVLTAGLRLDYWRNFDGFTRNTPLAGGGSSSANLPARAETALSPRLSILRKITNSWSLAASFYRSFRAPTLNELYRPFRVGNTVTLANNALRAERLTGGEASVLARLNTRMSMRGTFFWAVVDRPITNFTLSSTSDLITQRRENLGRTRSRGVEFEADAQLTSNVKLSGGYQFADSTILVSEAALIGKRVPQVARHQFSLQGRYSKPRGFTFAAQGRYVGPQFEDDRNRLVLDPFFTVDVFASRHVSRHLEVFAAAENLLNQRYMVGRTPTVTVGPPLLARIGLRFEWSGR
jgi:outer membrane receptor protein involved in Fe transport